jgi:plastocyanin
VIKTPFTRRGVLCGAVASAAALTIRSAHASQPVVHDIQMKRFKFDPAHITVKAGDVLRFTNQDLAPHTATADAFGWDTGEVSKGNTIEISVTGDMEISYFCAFHPHMKGTLEIV